VDTPVVECVHRVLMVITDMVTTRAKKRSVRWGCERVRRRLNGVTRVPLARDTDQTPPPAPAG
jgi:hypothetical protein